VTLLVDRLDPDAVVDDALVDLPAGATASFHVRTAARLDPAALLGRDVLRTANDVGVPRPVPGPAGPSAGAPGDLTPARG